MDIMHRLQQSTSTVQVVVQVEVQVLVQVQVHRMWNIISWKMDWLDLQTRYMCHTTMS